MSNEQTTGDEAAGAPRTSSDSAAVEAALSQIPGLAESMQPRASQAHAGEEGAGEEGAGDQEQQDPGFGASAREAPPDSEAVQAALSQIPGLKEQMGR